MAVRIPLVIVNGQIEQLQSGDTLSVASQFAISQTNGESSVALVIGMPVYPNGTADTVKRAEANSSSTQKVAGLWASTSTAASGSGSMQYGGVLVATTVQWGAVITGAPSGLTAGAQYYLDAATPGYITSTPPTTAGQFVCPIGVALDTTSMSINIQNTVAL